MTFAAGADATLKLDNGVEAPDITGFPSGDSIEFAATVSRYASAGHRWRDRHVGARRRRDVLVERLVARRDNQQFRDRRRGRLSGRRPRLH
jgi:hypothetical protein